MKAIYVFFTCISILFAVGCSNQNITDDIDTAADSPIVDPSQESAFKKMNWPLTVDSFSSSFTKVQPGNFAVKNTPPNKLSLTRNNDSITLSGAFHLAFQDKKQRIAYRSYRFYLKAGLHSLDAFFKEDQFINDADDEGKTLQKVAVAEKGYHVGWFRKA